MKAGALQAKVCLATATTADYLPGTLVTVGSFLKHHPDFAGDVVIIHDGLDERQCTCLGALSDRIRFVPVSAELRERLTRVRAALPQFARALPQLYAFEAYRLTGYRKLLLCDSDLLFRRPIRELFDSEDALLCCGCGVYLAGRRRDAATFLPLGDSDPLPAGILDRTFNDGFLLIDAALVGEGTYMDLLSMVTPETWRNTSTSHCKQFLHNRYFARRQTLISSTYNFVLRYADLITAREGLAVRDAKVLHFNLSSRPWMPETMLPWTYASAPVPGFDLWYAAWIECLYAAHLRTAPLLGRAARRE